MWRTSEATSCQVAHARETHLRVARRPCGSAAARRRYRIPSCVDSANRKGPGTRTGRGAGSRTVPAPSGQPVAHRAAVVEEISAWSAAARRSSWTWWSCRSRFADQAQALAGGCRSDIVDRQQSLGGRSPNNERLRAPKRLLRLRTLNSGWAGSALTGRGFQTASQLPEGHLDLADRREASPGSMLKRGTARISAWR